MDANEEMDSSTEEMTDLIWDCGIVDTHLFQDPYSEVETYARGREKIDYMLVRQIIQL